MISFNLNCFSNSSKVKDIFVSFSCISAKSDEDAVVRGGVTISKSSKAVECTLSLRLVRGGGSIREEALSDSWRIRTAEKSLITS